MDDQTTPPAAPTDGQGCGCSCEACMAGNHDQCVSGTCTVKNQPPADAEGQA